MPMTCLHSFGKQRETASCAHNGDCSPPSPTVHLMEPSSSGASSTINIELPWTGSSGASQLCCAAPLQWKVQRK